MEIENYTTKSVADAIRRYDGVKRKQAIGKLVNRFKLDCNDVIASYGEDAAVIKKDNIALLLASDGIWNKLMDINPYWAGYCSILVNIHDIAAMGGQPIAIVNIISAMNDEYLTKISQGMQDASSIFGVPIVGGHLHPDAPYNSIDVSILGTTELENVIYSSKSNPGDTIIVAIDLNGRVHPSSPLNWDSVTMKTPKILRDQIAVMKDIGKNHYVTSGKDISNPGIIGTLGMMIESSHIGATVDLTAIPHPDLKKHGITFEQWTCMYPGMGFIMTAKPENINIICKKFSDVGMTTKIIGSTNNSKQLTLVKGNDKTTLFDFSKEGITNI